MESLQDNGRGTPRRRVTLLFSSKSCHHHPISGHLCSAQVCRSGGQPKRSPLRAAMVPVGKAWVTPAGDLWWAV